MPANRRRGTALVMTILIALLSAPARAQTPVPKAAQKAAPTPIPGKTVVLRFEKIIRLEDDPTTFYEVELRDQIAYIRKGTTDQRLLVRIRGRYQKRPWALFCHSEDTCPGQPRIPSAADGTFGLNIVVTKKESILQLVVVPPNGQTHRHHFKLRVEGWPPQKASYGSSGTLALGASVTQISYREAGVEGQDQSALTLKFGFSFRLGETAASRWSLQFLNFVTAATFKTTREPPIRFLGINVRVGYDLPRIRRPWGIALYTGIYYQTTFVTNNEYGFANLLGPQLYPTLTYGLGRNRAISLYAKYSPILAGAAVLPLDNREIAAGIGYRWLTSDMHPVTVGLDLSQLRFFTDAPQLGETDLQSETLTASFGINSSLDALIGIFR